VRYPSAVIEAIPRPRARVEVLNGINDLVGTIFAALSGTKHSLSEIGHCLPLCVLSTCCVIRAGELAALGAC